MGKRADILIGTAKVATYSGAGTNYLVQTVAGNLYLIYINDSNFVHYRKSTNSGLTWGVSVELHGGVSTNLAIWYDRWSDISAGLIHVAFTESATDDTQYISIDTESADALSTKTIIFAGVSTAGGGHLSIVRARGGNLYCETTIDAGAEGGFYRSTDVGATWGARTVSEVIATQDQSILLPGWAADNQDIMAIFWDASANEISRKLYDDSADTWAETSISSGMTDQVATTAFPHFSATVDISNSKNIIIAWNGVDTANADLKAWTVTESAITALTDVVLNGTDDQGLAGISLHTPTGNLWAFYAGKSDGSETYQTAINIYCKCSIDAGTTWGAETQLTTTTRDIEGLFSCPRFFGLPIVAFYHDMNTVEDEILINLDTAYPRATVGIGI